MSTASFSIAAPRPAVRLAGLRFGWDAGAACLDLQQLVIAPGERVFLHGASGSGKSTLLALLAGILAPDSGQVEIAGTDLASLPPGRRDAFRADHIGMVFQQFNLVPYLSALENVLLACRFSRRRAAVAAAAGGTARAEARRLLLQLGIGPALHERGAARLSVGEQQRVAAARALIGGPGLVIADEPTSALDERNADIFLELLLAECRAPAALVLVSHDPRLARRFARSVALADINRAAPPGAMQ